MFVLGRKGDTGATNRMARTVLINPPTVLYMDSLSFTNSIPPLGLAYLAAATRKAGHGVSVIDAPGEAIEDFRPIHGGGVDGMYLHGLTPDEIVNRVDPDADVIGITHMFLHSWPALRDLTRRLRAAHPEKLIVMGGETPTAIWDHMMKDAPQIDVCVLGEGEATFPELLDALDRGKSFENIPGIATRDTDGTPRRSADTYCCR